MGAIPGGLAANEAQAVLAEVRRLCAAVGAEVAEAAGRLRASASDKGAVDVVTAADKLSEQRLTEALHRRFPAHRIAGEEGTRLGPADSPWTWHIDPLDGTANFSRGLPYWMLSVGLAFQQRPVLGVVHGPECRLTVSGIDGVGAWSGEDPLPPAAAVGAERTWLVATDWPWDLAQRERVVRLLAHLAPRIRQFKTYGSAAVDLAHVAIGRVDAYVIPHIFPWDQCGGAAACAALGYELRTWAGAAWDLSHPDIAVCRPGMWDLLGAACSA